MKTASTGTRGSSTRLPRHHVQQELCSTRPAYRQGRKLTAVKVYTINSESQHLLVYGIPKINLSEEVRVLCAKFGNVQKLQIETGYPTEEFTECMHVQYDRIQSARIAKRFMDNKSFYGGHLHVCYAPEFESVVETKEKFKQREKDVLSRLESGPSALDYLRYQPEEKLQENRKRKHPAIPITEKRLKHEDGSIWDGVPPDIDPRKPSSSQSQVNKHFQISPAKGVPYGPYISNDVPDINVSVKKTRTTLLPTAVIKNHNRDYNKVIVYRKKQP